MIHAAPARLWPTPYKLVARNLAEPRRLCAGRPRGGDFGLHKRLFGAVEKTRTSTGFRPQRPQRCASTNSATTASSSRWPDQWLKATSALRLWTPRQGRSGPLAKGLQGCKRQSGGGVGRFEAGAERARCRCGADAGWIWARGIILPVLRRASSQSRHIWRCGVCRSPPRSPAWSRPGPARPLAG